jgi:hypothetical protein
MYIHTRARANLLQEDAVEQGPSLALRIFRGKINKIRGPGGVTQWTSHPPQEQKSRVRILQRARGFLGNIAVLSSMTDFIRIFVS